MPTSPLSVVLRHIRRVTPPPGESSPTDRQLLERFAADRDESAFAALLARHGPMVLGVCRGILRDAHIAEDAFQATFLILARKASAIRRHESLGGWLYQVARRAALRARTTTRPTESVREVEVMGAAEPWLDLSLRELQEAVSEEVSRLPEKYRTPLVLCHVEGKTQDEAARLLGASLGAVKGRLERGRRLLRARLTKRGLALPAGVFTTVMAELAAAAPVAGPLAATTVRAAVAAVSGTKLVGVSAGVATLVQEVSQAMATKVKIMAVLTLAAFGVAGAGAFYSAGAGMPTNPPAVAQTARGTPAVDAPKAAEQGETLQYSARVIDKETGTPILGVTVIVHRFLHSYVADVDDNQIYEDTRHTTDPEGKYSFTIPPQQSSQRNLHISLDFEHPDYASIIVAHITPLSRLRGEGNKTVRPDFETVAMRPGRAITGALQTPEGKPAAGVRVLAYSITDKVTDHLELNREGSFALSQTDANGRFRLPIVATGWAVYWFLPDQYMPETHILSDNKRGDIGTFVLGAGVRLRGIVFDVEGQPLAGVNVAAEDLDRRNVIDRPDGLSPVGDHHVRTAVTNEKGEFEMRPLALGSYRVSPTEDYNDASQDLRPYKRRPLPALFLGSTVVLKDGANPQQIVIRAMPQVVVEARYVDSQGRPSTGPGGMGVNVSGRMGDVPWRGGAKVEADGRIVIAAPLGLENAQLAFTGGQSMRWRWGRAGPLNNVPRFSLGNLIADVKGLEFVRYAPTYALVKVISSDGKLLTNSTVRGVYGPTARVVPGQRPVSFLAERVDGFARSSMILPDEDVTIVAASDGYTSKSVQVKLTEGEIKKLEIVLEKLPDKNDGTDKE